MRSAVGAWLNLAILVSFALRDGSMRFSDMLMKVALAVDAAAAALAVTTLLSEGPLSTLTRPLARIT